MSLIEGIGDEVTILFSVLFLLLLLCLAWLSTGVRERPLNVIVLDRQTFYLLLRRLRLHVVPNRNREQENRSEAVQAEPQEQLRDTGNNDNSSEPDPNETSHQGPVPEESVSQSDNNDIVPGQVETERPDATENVLEENIQHAQSLHANISREVTHELNTSESTEASCPLEQDTVEPVSESELRHRRLAFFEKQSDKSNASVPAEQEAVEDRDSVTDALLNDLPQASESRSEAGGPILPQVPPEGPSLVQSIPPVEEVTSDNVTNDELQEGHIRIRLKYLDDRQRLVQARPEDTVGTFKRRHFAGELAENMMVRFVCNGQELRQDAQSLQSYNIQDNSVIHCLLSRVQQATQPGQQQRSTEFDMGTLMFPLFGLILVLMWYCRFTYKQYFNAMSTFSLIGITFLYLIALLASWRLQEVHEHDD